MTKTLIGSVKMKGSCRKLTLVLLFLSISVLFTVLASGGAYATDNCTADGAGAATQTFAIPSTNMLSQVIVDIKQKFAAQTQLLYIFLTLNTGLVAAVHSAIVIYIAFYGIMFMSGIIPIKLYDFLMRLVKIAIIGMLFNGNTFVFFNDTVVKFFIKGTDEIIRYVVTDPATTIIDPEIDKLLNDDNSAITPADSALGKILSSRMLVSVFALAAYPEYGIFYALLLAVAIWKLLKALVVAMWVYVMSIVVRMLLLGLAPLFIPTILFQRTRTIFDGWINQLVAASLQPILLFTFFMFFLQLMEGCIDLVLSIPVCYAQLPKGYMGTPFSVSFWQFMETGASGWEPPSGVTPLGPTPPPPISLIGILTFLVIAEVASRFNSVVIQISSQIASAGTNLASGLENVMDSAKNQIAGKSSKSAATSLQPTAGKSWFGSAGKGK